MGVQEPEKFTQVAAGGQHAVTLSGGVQVRLTDCAFGPHAALIAFQGDKDARLAGASARLDHCSALLTGESAVCRLENAGPCSLDVRHSLLSRPEGEFPGGVG